MPRLLNTRRLFLSAKNKCSFCNVLFLLLLATICVLLMLQVRLQLDSVARSQEIATSPPPARIFCIIICFAYRHQHVGIHIQRTWPKHCDHYIFVSDDVHHILEPAVFNNLQDKWQLLRAHLEYVYKYHFHQGDWFLYANDDNFVLVENLRYMLQSYSPEELIYIGCKLRSSNGVPFMYDKSGIVFSGAALKQFVLEALPNESLCSSKPKGDEATEELGKCLINVNVLAVDSRDDWQAHRFLPFETEIHLGGQLNKSLDLHKYFLDHTYYPVINMNLPVSLRSICYHLNQIECVYDLYYFTYQVRIFGGP
ncbi:hypothetical protein KR009_004244, partial [Drosophila setifemur]